MLSSPHRIVSQRITISALLLTLAAPGVPGEYQLQAIARTGGEERTLSRRKLTIAEPPAKD